MKKILLGFVLLAAFTGTIFAADILPGLSEYAASILPGDAILLSMFPNTRQTEEKLLRLRHGEHNLIVDERVIGPSNNRISVSTIDAHKMHALASLAAKMNSYVRGEAYLIVYSDELASTITTEITSTIVFAEILRNSREELRLTYTFKTSDGQTGYGVSIWLAADKSLLDEEIRQTAAAVSSGNRRTDRRVEPGTAEVRRASQQETSVSDSVADLVQSRMSSNERILRFREENRMLLGFDD